MDPMPSLVLSSEYGFKVQATSGLGKDEGLYDLAFEQLCQSGSEDRTVRHTPVAGAGLEPAPAENAFTTRPRRPWSADLHRR